MEVVGAHGPMGPIFALSSVCLRPGPSLPGAGVQLSLTLGSLGACLAPVGPFLQTVFEQVVPCPEKRLLISFLLFSLCRQAVGRSGPRTIPWFQFSLPLTVHLCFSLYLPFILLSLWLALLTHFHLNWRIINMVASAVAPRSSSWVLCPIPKPVRENRMARARHFIPVQSVPVAVERVWGQSTQGCPCPCQGCFCGGELALSQVWTHALTHLSLYFQLRSSFHPSTHTLHPVLPWFAVKGRNS